jgi:hypothetical protein
MGSLRGLHRVAVMIAALSIAAAVSGSPLAFANTSEGGSTDGGSSSPSGSGSGTDGGSSSPSGSGSGTPRYQPSGGKHSQPPAPHQFVPPKSTVSAQTSTPGTGPSPWRPSVTNPPAPAPHVSVPAVIPEPVPAPIQTPAIDVPVTAPSPAPEAPAPPPIVTPPAAGPVVAPAVHVMLTSRVGTATVALTIILIFLTVGLWFYGNRLASQLTTRREQYA